MPLTLTTAQTIIAKTLEHPKIASFKPFGIVVFDTRGTVIATAVQDGQGLNLSRF